MRTWSSAKKASVFFFLFSSPRQLEQRAGSIRITGLDPNRLYELSLWEKPETPSPLMRDSILLSLGDVLRLSGSFLDRSGIVLPVGFPDSAVVLEGKPPEAPKKLLGC
jgi:hypothetical protein